MNCCKAFFAEIRSQAPSAEPPTTGRKEEQIAGEALFGSWSGTLCDGMTLSLSSYGPEGICEAASKFVF